MNAKHTINEGLSYAYLIPAFWVLIGTVLLAIILSPIALIGLFVVLALALAKTGVEIDLKKQTILSYGSILGHKFGEAQNLKNYDQVVLLYTQDKGLTNFNTGWVTGKVKTYDLHLHKGITNQFLFHQFTDYQLARKTLSIIEKSKAVSVYNQVVEINKSAMERRKRRGKK